MYIHRLKTNRIVNPLGFDLGTPSLSWVTVNDEGKKQKWARVEISLEENFVNLLLDTGEDEEISSIAFRPQIQLSPRTRYFWRVTVCDENDNKATSNTAWFETGKMDENFNGIRITPDLAYDVTPYLKKSFVIDGEIKSARAYFTALGVYELYINGKKAGDEFLAPGCDSYPNWLQYQTYNVTELLTTGENTIGMIIGNGWAKGKFGFDGKSGSYEENCKGEPSDIFTDIYTALGDLVITTDKGEEVISTDETWLCAPSPITFSSIYDGERFDGRLYNEDWCSSKDCGFDWKNVKAENTVKIGEITDRLSLPVKKMHSFKPELIITEAGEYVLDTKQEISGWIEFYCDVPKGTEIILQYGEILQDGNFYRDNMRSALCEYRFISNGEPHYCRPITTFYGFRYCKVTGLTEEPDPAMFTAWAIYSDMETTGSIVTDNEKVNRLFQNCLWSQRDNFVDVPTDCPQRDERMGWTGDAQAFCPTANFNMDCLPFYVKYGKDLYIDQSLNGGRVPHVTPLISKGENMLTVHGGACGWADAATVVPWMTYIFTGDVSIIENQYNSMKDWAEWVYRHDEAHGGDRLWHETEMHFGDWLALDGAKSGFDPEAVIGGTDNTFLCSVYYYYSTLLVSKASKVLGKKDESEKYYNRSQEILSAIRDEFFTKGGRCAAATQTGNALSLHFGIAPEEHREKVLAELQKLLKLNDMHLKTGFLGTPVLCRALSDNGANADAFTLFLQEDLPSWLYEVNMGATTIWERWNSILPNGKISGISMNSMNHYAYGAVIEWVYRNVCGLNPCEDAAGFKKIHLKPQPDNRLGSIEAKIQTASGEYISAWKADGDYFSYTFKIPFNTNAYLELDASTLKELTINGKKLDVLEGKIFVELCSGEYIVK